ncbi:MAG: helix-turn-helix transcriptional regulator [Ruminococcaceae bacterium]|nr:helix-turn-helix transcriptional regulator [Oscillospiraceae bacterium]
MFMKMEGLRTIRKQKHLSQLKVAMDLSISREALSYYENGKRSPDIAMLVRLSDYYNVSIDYLIRGHEFQSKY